MSSNKKPGAAVSSDGVSDGNDMAWNDSSEGVDLGDDVASGEEEDNDAMSVSVSGGDDSDNQSIGDGEEEVLSDDTGDENIGDGNESSDGSQISYETDDSEADGDENGQDIEEEEGVDEEDEGGEDDVGAPEGDADDETVSLDEEYGDDEDGSMEDEFSEEDELGAEATGESMDLDLSSPDREQEKLSEAALNGYGDNDADSRAVAVDSVDLSPDANTFNKEDRVSRRKRVQPNTGDKRLTVHMNAETPHNDDEGKTASVDSSPGLFRCDIFSSFCFFQVTLKLNCLFYFCS